MVQTSPTFRRDAKVIGLVCFPHMLSHAYWLTIPPMYAILVDAFGLTGDLGYTRIALATTCFAAATFIMQTPLGFVVDRIGARYVLIGGLALEAAAIGSISMATEYWHLLVLASLAGAGHAVYHPADYAILSSRISEHRMGRAFSIHSATGYLGFVVAPIFMTGVAALWHWRIAFLLIGLVGLAAVLVLIIFSDALRDDPEHKPMARRQSERSSPDFTTSEGIRLLFSIPVMMCFCYFVLHQMGSGGLRSFLVAALADLYATPPLVAASALSAFTAGSIAGILSGGVVADRFGPRMTTACATLLPAAIGVALLGWIELDIFGLSVLLAAVGCLIGILIPSRDLLLRSITPPGSMGKVMGFASTGANLGGATIPLALGYAMDTGGGSWVFWLTAAFMGAACLTFITARGRSERMAEAHG